MKFKPLVIGNLTAPIPIIQGGMGVGVSLSSLAGAVAKEGGIGTISVAQPGFCDPDFLKDPVAANKKAIAYHLKRAREIAPKGIIAINIMRASQNYDEYVACCVENGADFIVSGAGLPVNLPELVKNTGVKFAPIVSSLKACQVLFKMWDRRYHCVSDLVVIEGPKAGGHLGFKPEQLSMTDDEMDKEIQAILAYVKTFEEKYQKKIPVVFGGGVYDQKDIEHYLNLGCAGVQIATRFVVTEECDAAPAFKQAYLNAKKEDIMIVKSPVGMPGRAIRTPFMAEREKAPEKISHCFNCLDKCNPATTPYCITAALIRAVEGETENSLVFCGENAYRLDHMTTVHELMKELTE